MRHQRLYDDGGFYGPVALRCAAIVDRYVHGRNRRVKIRVNPVTGLKTFGYHDFDGRFITVDPHLLGLY